MTDGHQARWARQVIDSLCAGGVADLVVSPGSRSTPFLLAAIEVQGVEVEGVEGQGRLRLHNVIDERSAGFLALGISRASGKPAALLCTSGSAAGHYMPAVMEAFAAGVPLIVLSADRPPELHGGGANQTTTQQLLFGGHVTHFVDLGRPDPSELALSAMARRIATAVLCSRSPRPGPVHINAPVAKPLEGISEIPSVTPTQVFAAEQRVSDHAMDAMITCLSTSQRPLVVGGPAAARHQTPLSARALRRSARLLAGRLGAPLLSDLTSELDGAPFLSLPHAHAPDLILQLGRPPIDSQWERWARGIPRIVLAEQPWPDPTSDASLLVLGGLTDALDRLAGRTEPREPWLPALETRLLATLALIEECTLGPAYVARLLSDEMPAGGQLMAGNSLAVRHLDLFASRGDYNVLHQRGLSGIDGLVAGAAGAATTGRPTALLLGDVSLAHDLSSLGVAVDIAASGGACLVVVVVNDQGGRIFERLPIKNTISDEHFETYFAMEPALEFRAAAALYGAAFFECRSTDTFMTALKHAFSSPGCTLIEAVVDPGHADRLHHQTQDALANMW